MGVTWDTVSTLLLGGAPFCMDEGDRCRLSGRECCKLEWPSCRLWGCRWWCCSTCSWFFSRSSWAAAAAPWLRSSFCCLNFWKSFRTGWSCGMVSCTSFFARSRSSSSFFTSLILRKIICKNTEDGTTRCLSEHLSSHVNTMNNNSPSHVPTEHSALTFGDKSEKNYKSCFIIIEICQCARLLHLSSFTCHIVSAVNSSTAKSSCLLEIRVKSPSAPTPPAWIISSQAGATLFWLTLHTNYIGNDRNPWQAGGKPSSE